MLLTFTLCQTDCWKAQHKPDSASSGLVLTLAMLRSRPRDGILGDRRLHALKILEEFLGDFMEGHRANGTQGWDRQFYPHSTGTGVEL